MLKSLWLSALLLLGLLSPAFGLHFYLNGNEQKCFIEELSKDLQLQGLRFFFVKNYTTSLLTTLM